MKHFMALDLELNQRESGPKIIQVGWSIGDMATGEILLTKEVCVNPHEQLLPRIVELTGITQAMVDSAGTLVDAYYQLIDDHEAYECISNPAVWGGGDVRALREELGSESSPPNHWTKGYTEWRFGHREFDIKTIYQFHRLLMNKTVQSGLSKSCHRAGVQFIGRKHTAGADAMNTLRLFFKLYENYKPLPELNSIYD